MAEYMSEVFTYDQRRLEQYTNILYRNQVIINEVIDDSYSLNIWGKTLSIIDKYPLVHFYFRVCSLIEKSKFKSTYTDAKMVYCCEDDRYIIVYSGINIDGVTPDCGYIPMEIYTESDLYELFPTIAASVVKPFLIPDIRIDNIVRENLHFIPPEILYPWTKAEPATWYSE